MTEMIWFSFALMIVGVILMVVSISIMSRRHEKNIDTDHWTFTVLFCMFLGGTVMLVLGMFFAIADVMMY